MKPDLRKIDALFSAHDKPGQPGYAVAVLKDGRAIYQRGFGSKRLGVHDPITPRTVFNLGSVSKQFTAFCLLLLQDCGTLSLEDSLCFLHPFWLNEEKVELWLWAGTKPCY